MRSNPLDELIGAKGGVYVSGTGVNNTGPYCAIYAFTTTTFTTLTSDNVTGTMAGSLSMAAGTIIRGNFTVVTLAGGTAILYYA